MDRRPPWAYLLVSLAALAVYAPKLFNPFQWDDFHFILRDRFVQDPANLLAFFATDADGLYRPLRSVVYLALHLVARGDPLPYQAAGIVFHLATCLLVLAIVRRLFADERAGFLAALLFAVHPLLTGRVANVTGSLDIPGVTLTLVAFLLFMAATDGGPRVRARRWGSVAVYALALLYSEEATALLPMVFLYGLARRTPRSRASGGDALAGMAPYLLVFALYLLARTFVLGRLGRAEGGMEGTLAQAFLFPVVLWRYALWFLFPVHLSAAYELAPTGVGHEVTAAALLLLGLGAVGIALLARARPMVAFSLAWFFCALLPFALAGTTGSLAEDRYGYHAAAGFLAAGVGTLAGEGMLRRPRWTVVLLCVAAVFGVSTVHRVRLWRDAEALWSESVANAPRSYAARINHGLALRAAGKIAEAEREFEAAAAIDPGRALAHVNLGQMYLEARDADRAAQSFSRALALDPTSVPALAGMANLLVVAGEYDRARELCLRALSFDGADVSVHNALAFIAYREGRMDEAMRRWEFVRDHAWDPRLAEGARRNLEALRSGGSAANAP